MFTALKRLLFPIRVQHHDVEQLGAIDVELVAEELDVYQSGAVDGRNNSPEANASDLSLAEVRIVGFFQDEAQAATKFFRDKILDLQKLLKQKSLVRYEDRLSSIVPSFKAAIDTIVAQSKPNLVDLKRRENELHDEYTAFRRSNHLTRSADYPENRFFLVTILIGILLIEAVLNGYFFAQANELAWLAVLAKPPLLLVLT